ncbi:MAG: IclR family transcriptional regulator, partial [Micromonosporaceae bacterium]
MRDRDPYTIESVDNALRVLLLLRQQPQVRVTDVSDQLGVARSTAHRLLSTLAHHGFVHQDRMTRAYRAGRVFIELGLAAVGDLDVRRKARQHLEALSEKLRETVNLLVLEGAGSRFIDGVEGDRPVRVSLRTGVLLPASSTSGGKVLLAELPVDEVRA